MAVLCTENARDLFGFVQMTKEIEKNYPGLVDFGSGTTIVLSNPVKMRLSYKDLLLLIGILVAVIIAFTTLVYHEPTGESKQTLQKSTPHPRPLSEAERGEVSSPPIKRLPLNILNSLFNIQI